MSAATNTTSLAPLLERFFTQRLMQQRQVSPHTISSYRDTFRLPLTFSQERLHTQAARLALAQLDAPFILEFLDHLERYRGLSPQPESSPHRYPLVLSLCRLRSADACRTDSTRTGHPQQALYTHAGAVSHAS